MALTWHYGGTSPHATKNDWSGTFLDGTAQSAFEAVTTTLGYEVTDNDGLLGVSLPQVTIISAYTPFDHLGQLTELYLPKLTTTEDTIMADLAFNTGFTITLPKAWDTEAKKRKLFGDQWNSVTYNWESGTSQPPAVSNQIIFGNKIQDTQYDWNGKTVAKFIYNGKECVLKVPGGNK